MNKRAEASSNTAFKAGEVVYAIIIILAMVFIIVSLFSYFFNSGDDPAIVTLHQLVAEIQESFEIMERNSFSRYSRRIVLMFDDRSAPAPLDVKPGPSSYIFRNNIANISNIFFERGQPVYGQNNPIIVGSICLTKKRYRSYIIFKERNLYIQKVACVDTNLPFILAGDSPGNPWRNIVQRFTDTISGSVDKGSVQLYQSTFLLTILKIEDDDWEYLNQPNRILVRPIYVYPNNPQYMVFLDKV